MKKIKSIYFLSLAAMLIGCGKTKYQAPTFKKYSNKVSYDVFATELSKLNVGTDGQFNCFTSKYDYYTQITETIKNSETKFQSEKMKENRDIANIQYDSETNQLAVAMQIEEKSEINESGEKKTNGESYKNDSVAYQLSDEEINGKPTLVAAYPTKKTYYKVADIDESHSTAKYAVNYVGMPISPIGEITLKYQASSDEEKNNYSFYVDKNLLTIHYGQQKSDEKQGNNGSEVVKTANHISVKETVLQIEAFKDKWSLVGKTTVDEKYEFIENDKEFGLYKGDTYVIKQSNYIISSLDFSTVKLKKIDYKQYKYIDFIEASPL